jgi:hypothetical protein
VTDFSSFEYRISTIAWSPCINAEDFGVRGRLRQQIDDLRQLRV